jgi:hypothetical protein
LLARKELRAKAMAGLVGIEVQDLEAAVKRKNLAHVRMSAVNVLGNNIFS